MLEGLVGTFRKTVLKVLYEHDPRFFGGFWKSMPIGGLAQFSLEQLVRSLSQTDTAFVDRFTHTLRIHRYCIRVPALV